MLSPGENLGRYQVVSRLGGGGMGDVYRARDTILHREVALKVLAGEAISRPDRKQRFIVEAQAASALNHPNIIVIYDIGSEQALDYIAMELVRGRTLDSLITGSGLPVRDVIRYGEQIASAIAAAHGAGIVHRDLKPANVMITDDGVAKVLDFGLAKLTQNTWSDSGVTLSRAAPTVEGTVLGTVAYMSPEQAEGRPVDARSDIFSFGAVLYEMTSGRRAFHADSAMSTMAAILRDQPAPLRGHVKDVPAELDALVLRCLEKVPERRYQSMVEVRMSLGRIRDAISSSGPRERAESAQASAASIAVLPFANLSADKENEYFSDGLAEEILNQLAKIPDLRVTARTSSFAFRGKDEDVRTVANILNVDTVLEGSVRRAGNRVRVAVQLIKASEGYQLWSERYDRDLTDIFAIQDEISTAIVNSLRERFGCAIGACYKLRHTPPIEAYNALLLGRYHRFRFTTDSYAQARQAFERAAELDPEYADAYANLAVFHIAEWALDITEPRAAIENARRTASKALELDPSIGLAHAVLGAIKGGADYDWPRAEARFAKALELDPNSPDIHVQYGYWFLRPQKRFHDARQQYRTALESDPLSTFARYAIAESYFFEGKFEQALEACRSLLELDPNYWPPRTMGANALAFMGRAEESREWIAKARALAPGDLNIRTITAWLSAVNGDPGPARDVAGELESREGWRRMPGMLAMIYGALGDVDRAFIEAGQMIETRVARALWIIGPAHRALQQHPRYPELLGRMHLDSAGS
jgi:serine/threonine protein kinase/Tfp pilus assembly protein PilF